jgi:methionyl-tRNA formyltransferase
MTALADRLQPDVIAVFGTSLIRGPLLSKGRLGIFNLHGGLSPQYRGADCTFWALYNGEPDRLACTLHRSTRGSIPEPSSPTSVRKSTKAMTS